MPDNTYGKETVELIHQLAKKGITRMAVMIRHSARKYDRETPENEPFLMLTEKGRDYAFAMGQTLPQGLTVRFGSSVVGRCIETAYLVDKGYLTAGGQTEHNRSIRILSPAYIRKPMELLKILRQNTGHFIRFWFEGNISPDIIDPAHQTAQNIVSGLQEQIADLPEDGLFIGVTHDWNLYAVKEEIMGLRHEEAGNVAYLEGLVIYEEQGKSFIVNHQTAPIEL